MVPPNKIVISIFGGGDDKHDYGRGSHLTENIDLAKWAVCRPNEQNGWSSAKVDSKYKESKNFWIFEEKMFYRGLQSL